MGYNPGHVFAVEEGTADFAAFNASSTPATNVASPCCSTWSTTTLALLTRHLRFDGWSQGDWGGVYFYNDDRGDPVGEYVLTSVATKWGVPR